MRAEHPAVDVCLVHDDVAEVVEDVGPAVVMREDADVEHVRVREDHVRPLANLPAPVGRRVAVVDRRADARCAELAERASLVLRESLRRVEVESPVLRASRDRVEDREVERERLSRGRPGREDQVLSARGRIPGRTLVGVQLVEGKRRAQRRMELLRQRVGARLGGGYLLDVRNLLAAGEVVPQRRADRHSAMVAWPDRGAFGLRTHPSNLIRFAPAKGVRTARTSKRDAAVGGLRPPQAHCAAWITSKKEGARGGTLGSPA